MQPVTAEIHRLPIQQKAAGVAAHCGGALHHRDRETAPRQLPRSAKSGRAAAQNHDRSAVRCYIGHPDLLSLRTVIRTYNSVEGSDWPAALGRFHCPGAPIVL
jgi:hypothetical protein